MLSSCHFAINLSDLWPAFLRKQVLRKKRWFPVIIYNIATSHIHTLCIYFNMTCKHGTSFEKDLTEHTKVLIPQDFRKKESWTCCFFANCSWKNYSESEIQIPHFAKKMLFSSFINICAHVATNNLTIANLLRKIWPWSFANHGPGYPGFSQTRPWGNQIFAKHIFGHGGFSQKDISQFASFSPLFFSRCVSPVVTPRCVEIACLCAYCALWLLTDVGFKVRHDIFLIEMSFLNQISTKKNQKKIYFKFSFRYLEHDPLNALNLIVDIICE